MSELTTAPQEQMEPAPEPEPTNVCERDICGVASSLMQSLGWEHTPRSQCESASDERWASCVLAHAPAGEQTARGESLDQVCSLLVPELENHRTYLTGAEKAQALSCRFTGFTAINEDRLEPPFLPTCDAEEEKESLDCRAPVTCDAYATPRVTADKLSCALLLNCVTDCETDDVVCTYDHREHVTERPWTCTGNQACVDTCYERANEASHQLLVDYANCLVDAIQQHGFREVLEHCHPEIRICIDDGACFDS